MQLIENEEVIMRNLTWADINEPFFKEVIEDFIIIFEKTPSLKGKTPVILCKTEPPAGIKNFLKSKNIKYSIDKNLVPIKRNRLIT